MTELGSTEDGEIAGVSIESSKTGDVIVMERD